MLTTILRKEHKNQWERRTCLTPEAIKNLQSNGYEIAVERSDVRIFNDQEYISCGSELVDSPASYQFVLGIKEPPVSSIQAHQVHLCFSHTHKGQAYNMELLQKFINQKATLIDYELITDDNKIRTIAFGRYAGIAGAVDTLSLAGCKRELSVPESILSSITQSWKYKDVSDIEEKLTAIQLPQNEAIRVVIVGSGKVGKGAEEVCQWLGLENVPSERLIAGDVPEQHFYTVLSTRHVVKKKGEEFQPEIFDVANYLETGKQNYESVFENYLGKFDILLHTPYWEEKYPKLLPLSTLKRQQQIVPEIIGDISADINGSLACTLKASDTDNPVFSFDINNNSLSEGLDKNKLAVMSIDNLPCELPKDASEHFSSILPQYIPAIMGMDLERHWLEINLPESLKRAVIVYQGELTPEFSYLEKYLTKK